MKHCLCCIGQTASRMLFALAIWLEEVASQTVSTWAEAAADWGTRRCR